MHHLNLSLIDIPGEEWRSIDDFPYYMISNMGRVKSLSKLKIRSKRAGNYVTKDKILKQRHDIDGYGYMGLSLCNEGGAHQRLVHILVAKAFIPNPENKPEVNHKWGVKTDNRASELEWATRSENQKHSYKIGLKSKAGEKHHLVKLNEEKVLEIRKIASEANTPNCVIAQKFNISQQTVCDILKRRSWTHI